MVQYINSYHGRSGKLQKNDIQYKEYSMVRHYPSTIVSEINPNSYILSPSLQ
jgi:hypothetical protein